MSIGLTDPFICFVVQNCYEDNLGGCLQTASLKDTPLPVRIFMLNIRHELSHLCLSPLRLDRREFQSQATDRESTRSRLTLASPCMYEYDTSMSVQGGHLNTNMQGRVEKSLILARFNRLYKSQRRFETPTPTPAF